MTDGSAAGERAALSGAGRGSAARILAFASVVEAATGVALIVDPALVARLLLGGDLAGDGVAVGRCFGVALFALAVSCWRGAPAAARSPDLHPMPLRAMLVYNALIAAYLAYLGVAGTARGLLLWPAVVVHAFMTLLLLQKWITERRLNSTTALLQ